MLRHWKINCKYVGYKVQQKLEENAILDYVYGNKTLLWDISDTTQPLIINITPTKSTLSDSITFNSFLPLT